MSTVTAGPTRRRWLATEVVQTSAMDCGPAALKCLLEGFRIPVSYGRLREACQTDVDGTSIDTIEVVANALGVSAEQVMIPIEHLFLESAANLDSIGDCLADGQRTLAADAVLERLAADVQDDVFPYPDSVRLRRPGSCFAAENRANEDDVVARGLLEELLP